MTYERMGEYANDLAMEDAARQWDAMNGRREQCSKPSCTGNCPCHVYFMAVDCTDGCKLRMEDER